jgi:aminopeptidase N
MPVAEVTGSECIERARLLRVSHYDIRLDLTRGPEVFGSTARATFDCTEPRAASYADLVAETVHEITLNGVALDPARASAGGRPRPCALAHSPDDRGTARKSLIW